MRNFYYSYADLTMAPFIPVSSPVLAVSVPVPELVPVSVSASVLASSAGPGLPGWDSRILHESVLDPVLHKGMVDDRDPC